eukprot:6462560-Amphidinium_carterae.1
MGQEPQCHQVKQPAAGRQNPTTRALSHPHRHTLARTHTTYTAERESGRTDATHYEAQLMLKYTPRGETRAKERPHAAGCADTHPKGEAARSARAS